MRVSDLSPEVLLEVKRWRYDQVLEKHEGPWSWASEFKWGKPEFLSVEGHWVLLPVEAEHHSNLSVMRCIPSMDGSVLTLFLKDTTFYDDYFSSGRLAICERFPDHDFYLATVYHEWFMIENPELPPDHPDL